MDINFARKARIMGGRDAVKVKDAATAILLRIGQHIDIIVGDMGRQIAQGLLVGHGLVTL